MKFKGFEIPGSSDVSIEVAKIVSNGSFDVDLVKVGVPLALEIPVPYIGGTPAPAPEDWLGYISRDDFVNISLLSLNGTETVDLGKLISNTTEVYLTFKNGPLVLEVISGGAVMPVTLV